MENKSVRIASGSGFWGDWPQAPIDQVKKGPVDYLVMDYLAEVTMSILHKQKSRDSSKGYATDFTRVVSDLLPLMQSKGFKVISNAGGANPEACRERILSIAREEAIDDLREEESEAVGDIEPEVQDIIDRELSNVTDVTREVIAGELTTF